MSILSRYLLKQHWPPFVFGLGACTSIMLLNQIARRLPELLGKGLPTFVIFEVFALSVPFLVAMTLPMAVLLAVLYTMTRLVSDNEITAIRAGGVSLGKMIRPLLFGGVVMAIVAFLFSDQILPRSNHRLRTLLSDIGRTKPTFSLEEQVINEVQRSRFFLRANQINPANYTLLDVTIYDVSDQIRKRTIYADSGTMAFGSDREDLYLTLFDGTMHETNRMEPNQLQIMNFLTKIIRVEGIGGDFDRTENDRFKGDREMSVCEMDSVVVDAEKRAILAEKRTADIELNSLRGLVGLAPIPSDTTAPEPPPSLYCRAADMITNFLLPAPAEAQQTRRPLEIGPGEIPGEIMGRFNQAGRVALETGDLPPQINSAVMSREQIRSYRVRSANYTVEVHKKYAIAAAAFVFVLVGVPFAMWFPQATLGHVIGISLGVFALYYVGLIGGESLGNQLFMHPALAMWIPNIVFTLIGLIGLWKVRTEATTSRSGGLSLARLITKRSARRLS
ncbi:MAG: LptF/LptG family permease [Gemmatimonadota bacterium]|nr:LptF/LptG family permease [Gemmatimonadota bacterium]